MTNREDTTKKMSKSNFDYKKKMNKNQRRNRNRVAAIIAASALVLTPTATAFGQSVDSQSSSSRIASPQVLDVSILKNTKLDASWNVYHDELSMKYTGAPVVDLGLLKRGYTYFEIPQELMDALQEDPRYKTRLSIDYKTPGLLGLIPNKGAIGPEDIIVEDNQIYVNWNSFLDLGLLTLGTYEFTLNIDLRGIDVPCDPTIYRLGAYASSQLINLNLLSSDKAAKTTIDAPDNCVIPDDEAEFDNARYSPRCKNAGK